MILGLSGELSGRASLLSCPGADKNWSDAGLIPAYNGGVKDPLLAGACLGLSSLAHWQFCGDACRHAGVP